MRKRLLIIFFLSVLSLSLYPFSQKDISVLRENELKLRKLYNDKVVPLLKSHPEYYPYLFKRGDILEKVMKRQEKVWGSKASVMPDTVRVLVLKVEFLEDTTSLTTGNGKMDTVGSSGKPVYIVEDGDTFINPEYQEEYILEIGDDGSRRWVHNLLYDPPHDSLYFHNLMLSLRNYYWDDSHGRLYVDFDIYPKGRTACYTVPHDMLYYGDINNFVGGLFNLLRDAVYEADKDPAVDFSKYDAVIIFHAGSMWQTDMGDSPYDIFAVYVGGAEYYFGYPITTDDGTVIDDAVIYPEVASQDNLVAFLQGGLAHEFGHALGLLDLYDTSLQRMGMGSWALMGTGNWNMAGLVPPHHSAYNAYVPYMISSNDSVYFNDVLTVTSDTTINLYPLSFNDDTTLKMIKVPINDKEYFLITNRFAYMNDDTISDDPDSSGLRVWKDGVLVKIDDYDMGLPMDLNTGGMAIYHIDQSVIDADSGWNMINTSFPFGVDMEEGSGVQDFELSFWDVSDWEAAFYGEPNDLYAMGHNLNMFGTWTMPSSKDNEGGNTFITIENLSSSYDTVLQCRIKFGYRQKGFPIKTNDELDVASPSLWERNDSIYLVIPSVNGNIFVYNSEGNSITSGSAVYTGDISYSTPAIGDIDKDGMDEIVYTTLGGKLWVYDTDSIFHGRFPVKYSIDLEYPIVGSPVIADINDDSLDEILVNASRHLYIVDSDGNIIDKIYLGQDSWSTPVFYNGRIYDLSGDGRLLCIEDTTILWYAGDISPTLTTSSPIVGDINKDGKEEIVFFSGTGKCIMVDNSGNILWEKELKDTLFYSSPVLADINGDGYLDIVAVGKELHLIDRNGHYFENFPIDVDTMQVQSSPVIADINGDNIYDIVFSVNNGSVHAYDYKGEEIRGFPISGGKNSFTTPLICDVDKDGDMEIITCSVNGWINGYDFNSSRIYSGCRYKNNSNNAVFENTLSVNDSVYTENIYFYPNPAGFITTLRWYYENDGTVTMRIYNVYGEKMYETSFDFSGNIVNERDIDISSVPIGVYNVIIDIDYNDGTHKRVIKKLGVVR